MSPVASRATKDGSRHAGAFIALLVVMAAPAGAIPALTANQGLPTTTTLSSDRNPIRVGLPITLTATVEPSDATGTVEFFEFGQRFGAAALVNGVATVSYSSSAVGSRTLSATYGGDATYAVSSGFMVEQVIPKITTALSLRSSENPSLAGRTVTLTATLTPAPASGAIDLFDSGVPIGTAAIDQGSAQLPYVLPAPCLRSMSAVYLGDTSYAATEGSLMQQVYTRFPTMLDFTSTANPSTTLDVDVTVRVTPPPPKGEVAIADDDGALSTLTLANGMATFHYRAPRFVTRTLIGSYAGDADYLPAQRSYTQDFRGIRSTTTLQGSHNPAPVQEPLELTAAVDPAAATGTIEIRDSDNRLLGNVPVVDGVGTLDVRFDTIWSGSLSAHYSGDTTYSESSGSMIFSVVGHPTSTVLSTSADRVVHGTHVRFTAQVDPPVDIGDVWFYVDGAIAAIVSSRSGSASFTISTLTNGYHQVTAGYQGGGVFAGSVSNDVTEFVSAATEPFLRVLSPNDGETWTVGSAVEIHWDPTTISNVRHVWIFLSRSVPLHWETLASDVPNTGSYAWVVTPPGTNTGATPVMSAIVSVSDPSGQVGSDTSDLPFSILDPQTEAELIRLDAEPFDGGVRVTWALSDAASLARVELERATSSVGPWNRISASAHEQDGVMVTEDRDVEMGTTYLYRLLATTIGGAQQVFGPISVTTARPSAFALSGAWPNPTAGPMRFRFDVPRRARVKLSIVDPMGREWATLADGEYPVGRHDAVWDARSSRGPVPPGVYFARLVTPDGAFVRRLAIVP